MPGGVPPRPSGNDPTWRLLRVPRRRSRSRGGRDARPGSRPPAAPADPTKAVEKAPKGGPADALIGVAEDRGADLIVMGSVGMKGPKRIFGSVPNSVSHRAPCDVLIVRTDGR